MANKIFDIEIRICADRLVIHFSSKDDKIVVNEKHYRHFENISKRLSSYLLGISLISEPLKIFAVGHYLKNGDGQITPYNLEVDLSNLRDKTNPKPMNHMAKSVIDFFFANEISFSLNFDEPEIPFF